MQNVPVMVNAPSKQVAQGLQARTERGATEDHEQKWETGKDLDRLEWQ
jgi:hypothetical protein